VEWSLDRKKDETTYPNLSHEFCQIMPHCREMARAVTTDQPPGKWMRRLQLELGCLATQVPHDCERYIWMQTASRRTTGQNEASEIQGK
jgi:hypothetical protein